MPAIQETIEHVKKIGVDQYKYGFETRIKSIKAPKGLNESTCALHLGQEGRARLDAYLAARQLRALARDEGADVGEYHLPEN